MDKTHTSNAIRIRWTGLFLLVCLTVGFVYYFGAATQVHREPAGTQTKPALISPPQSKAYAQSNMQVGQEKIDKFNSDKAALEEKNRRHLKVFFDDGWREAESEPHDPKLLALDPNLLNEREHDLRKQLETTRVSTESMENAAIIALNAKESRTRMAAIESIGHGRSGDGAELLMTIFDGLEDESERSKAIGFIHIDSLESTEANWAIDQLSDPDLPESLSGRIANKLLMVGVMEHNGDESFLPSLMEKVPVSAREVMAQTLAYVHRQ